MVMGTGDAFRAVQVGSGSGVLLFEAVPFQSRVPLMSTIFQRQRGNAAITNHATLATGAYLGVSQPTLVTPVFLDSELRAAG